MPTMFDVYELDVPLKESVTLAQAAGLDFTSQALENIRLEIVDEFLINRALKEASKASNHSGPTQPYPTSNNAF
jgi:hypothetical protein